MARKLFCSSGKQTQTIMVSPYLDTVAMVTNCNIETLALWVNYPKWPDACYAAAVAAEAVLIAAIALEASFAGAIADFAELEAVISQEASRTASVSAEAAFEADLGNCKV